ncbi:DUF6898 family protein [Micavibrio aeruginosavorus]|uniref:DUF6898 domain-containing protein n=1 Tax=Micavibrio aeruginosavorus (strain ARL-13) TaxID=856793 RepID=G2KLT7_MICAA|nr:hypothetical protein [Micavibrio aeruginosavorus]AEP09316.1 putative uncharacterized protein [Micavibrio aeruginosavorus ARL-13]
MTDNPLKNREVIIEFQQIGTIVRVSAMDVKTLTEAIIQGPANTPKPILERNALKKLEYTLKKKGIIPA